MIALAGIAKAYGAYPALYGIDLAINEGEFVALLGPSGSGKTTLLRIIAGLDAPDAGSVMIAGQDVAGVRVAERGVGFVFQNYALFRHMNVAANVGFGLAVQQRWWGGWWGHERGLSRAALRARVAELLALVQLEGLGDRYPEQLSGGQRQRVALARALATNPRLLLLDEPFGALDARVRVDLRRALRSLHRRMGLTSVFVTHDQDEALELADRVVVINAGRIEQIGTPSAIYETPASAFVAHFVGETNRVPAALLGAAGGLETMLYLRPHELSLVPEDAPAAAALARFTVTDCFRKGAAWRVEGHIDGWDAVIAIDRAAEDALPQPGEGWRLRVLKALG